MEAKGGDSEIKTYRESHTLGPVYAILIGAMAVFYVVITVGAIAKHQWKIAVLIGVLLLAIIIALVNFWRLVFEITETEVIFGFGVVKKRFQRSAVTSCEPYELKFKKYLGYGIRMGLDGTTAFNTRNGPGVKLVFEGAKRPYVVSVDEPAYVCKVLGRDGGEPEP
ncbi:MAG: hypothetical protein ACYC99_05320 [Candidatus Geothermincolia bacterium]